MSERRLLINVASLKKSSIVVGDEVVDVDGSEETPLSTSTNSSLLVPFVDKKRLICLLLLFVCSSRSSTPVFFISPSKSLMLILVFVALETCEALLLLLLLLLCRFTRTVFCGKVCEIQKIKGVNCFVLTIYFTTLNTTTMYRMILV